MDEFELIGLAFDQASIGAALTDPDGRFRRVNGRFALMTGYAEDELIGLGFQDITHEDDVVADVVQVRRLAAGEIEEYAREERYVRKDSSIAWGEVVVRPLRDASGTLVAFIALVNDITERRREQQAMVESLRAVRRADRDLAASLRAVDAQNERLTGLIDTMVDEVWFVDAAGHFTMANPAALTAFGAGAADDRAVVELADSLEVLRPDGSPRPSEEAPPLRALAGEVVRNQEETVRLPVTGELRHRIVNATPIKDADGTVLGCVCVVRDVTELKQAEQEVLHERDKARSYLDVAGVMLVAIAADQTVLFANRKACEVLERREADLVGANWFDTCLPEAQREPTRKGFKQLIADNVTPWQHNENRVVTRSGEEKLIAWHNTVLRDDGGRIMATLSSGEDVTERRRTEEALRESEAKYRSVVERASDGVGVIDAQETVVFVNEALAQMSGYSEDELVGASFLEFVVEEQRATVADRMRRRLAGDYVPGNSEIELVHKDGTHFSTEASAAIVPFRGAPADLIILRDITARKQTERLMAVPSEILRIISAPLPIKEVVDGVVGALKRATGFDAVGLRLKEGEDYPFLSASGYSDEFLSAENSLAVRYPDGGICRDSDGNISLECTCGLVVTGKVDPANPSYTAGGSAWTNDSLPSLDVPPRDLRLNPRNRCIHAGFRSVALVPLRAGDEILGLLHLADRRASRLTAESIRFLEGLGAGIGVALAGKRAEAALRQSESKYRIIADNTSDWEWWTAPDGSYLYVSPSVEGITGRAPAEFLADPDLLPAISHPDDREAVRAHVKRSNSGEAAPSELVFRVSTLSGDERVIEHRCKPVYGADGTYLGRRGSNRDITERQRAADEIAHLNAGLRERIVSRTEEMEAATKELESFAYSVSHDLRAPLRTIDGFSAMVLEDTADTLDGASADHLRRVRQASQRLLRLIDDLLGLSVVSRREMQREPCDLSEIAGSLGAELAAENAGHRVELTVAPGMVVDADPYLLRVILRELLENAWKFSVGRHPAHLRVRRARGGRRARLLRA